MEPGTLQQIIASLENAAAEEQASFGIFTDNQESIDANIRANPEGLKLFAAKILAAAAALEQNPSEPVRPGLHGRWISGSVYLDEIYPPQPEIANITEVSTGKAGCVIFIIILAILAVIFITGLVTVVQWAMRWWF